MLVYRATYEEYYLCVHGWAQGEKIAAMDKAAKDAADR